jgi:hypothetical protein
MSWFSVSLLFRSIHNGLPSDTDLWEERIILVDADIEEDAKKIALKIGKSEEHDYFTASDNSISGEFVKWTFIQVERVCEIDGNTMINGLEIFTRYLRHSEVESILTPFD